MRTLLAAAMIALVACAAYAQGTDTGRQRHAHMRKGDGPKKKPDDANAKSPLETLPDQTFDPWHNMRSVEPPKADKTPN